jgi:hypothetical protein
MSSRVRGIGSIGIRILCLGMLMILLTIRLTILIQRSLQMIYSLGLHYRYRYPRASM